MEIEFMRALTPGCREKTTCWMCGSWFKPAIVLIYGGPHGEEMCELCFRACHERQRMSNVPADWPTWSEYLNFCDIYKEPVFKDGDECEQAENLGLYGDFERLAYLI